MPHVERFDPELERAGSRMDSIERRLQRFNNPAPTVPQYDLQFAVGPSTTTVYMAFAFKSYPKWWNSDDTYNGNTTWLSGGPPSDHLVIARLNGSNWETVIDFGVGGVWTPNSQPAGKPTPIAAGQVGNWWTSPDADNGNTGYLSGSYYFTPGDQLAVVAFAYDGWDLNWGSNFGSNPKSRVWIYSDSGYSSLLHEFEELSIPVGSYIISDNVGPWPASTVWSGATWTVP